MSLDALCQRKELLMVGYIRQQFTTHIVTGIILMCLQYYDDDPKSIYPNMQPLGESSFGTVFKAINRYNSEAVFIKIIYYDDEDQLNAIKQYINWLKSSNSKSNGNINQYSQHIVGYKDSLIKHKDNDAWIIKEYCAVGSMNDIIKFAKVSLTEQQIQIIIKKSLNALKYLYTKKIACDNFKASKIYLTDSGQCKIDIIKCNKNPWLVKCASVVTPYWMSPEELTEMKHDIKSIIWSLGITAIEMATGKPPRSDMAPLRVIFMIPKCDPPQLPLDSYWSESFRDFVRLCCMKNPNDRPSVDQLLKHKWINDISIELKVNVLCNLANTARPLMEKYRMELKEKQDDSDNNEDDCTWNDEDEQEEQYGTMVLENEDNLDDYSYGTMLKEQESKPT